MSSAPSFIDGNGLRMQAAWHAAYPALIRKQLDLMPRRPNSETAEVRNTLQAIETVQNGGRPLIWARKPQPITRRRIGLGHERRIDELSGAAAEDYAPARVGSRNSVQYRFNQVVAQYEAATGRR